MPVLSPQPFSLAAPSTTLALTPSTNTLANTSITLPSLLYPLPSPSAAFGGQPIPSNVITPVQSQSLLPPLTPSAFQLPLPPLSHGLGGMSYLSPSAFPAVSASLAPPASPGFSQMPPTTPWGFANQPLPPVMPTFLPSWPQAPTFDTTLSDDHSTAQFDDGKSDNEEADDESKQVQSQSSPQGTKTRRRATKPPTSRASKKPKSSNGRLRDRPAGVSIRAFDPASLPTAAPDVFQWVNQHHPTYLQLFMPDTLISTWYFLFRATVYNFAGIQPFSGSLTHKSLDKHTTEDLLGIIQHFEQYRHYLEARWETLSIHRFPITNIPPIPKNKPLIDYLLELVPIFKEAHKIILLFEEKKASLWWTQIHQKVKKLHTLIQGLGIIIPLLNPNVVFEHIRTPKVDEWYAQLSDPTKFQLFRSKKSVIMYADVIKMRCRNEPTPVFEFECRVPCSEFVPRSIELIGSGKKKERDSSVRLLGVPFRLTVPRTDVHLCHSLLQVPVALKLASVGLTADQLRSVCFSVPCTTPT